MTAQDLRGSGEPIRVAFVLHVMQVAGAEVLVAETIRRLGGALDPTVVCLDAVGQLGAQLQTVGIPVISLGRQPGRDFKIGWKLAAELRRRSVEVIHAHQYTPFFYSAIARLLLGTKPRLIFTEHGRHYPDVVSGARRRLNSVLLAKLASDVNAVCEFSARALREIDGFSRVPVHVIENGIDPGRYHRSPRAQARSRVGLDSSRQYVVTIARFHPVKDHSTLLTAFRTVATARPNVDLLLVGDGPLRRDLEAQADRFELRPRVHFLGVRADVPELLDAADVFCLSSVSEAASLTLMEAMASALPVVVSAVGGNTEIVRDEQEGLLFPRGDASSLSAALLRVLGDDPLARRLGEAGARRVRATYQLDRTVGQYYKLYRALARDPVVAVGSPACSS